MLAPKEKPPLLIARVLFPAVLYKKLLETLLYYADEHHWDGERCGTVINSWDDYYSSGRIYHYDKGQKARDILKELNI